MGSKLLLYLVEMREAGGEKEGKTDERERGREKERGEWWVGVKFG